MLRQQAKDNLRLNDNILEAIAEIRLHTTDNVLKNWADRVGYCMVSRSSIIFALLTGRTVLSNKKRNLNKYSVVFLKHPALRRRPFSADFWQTVGE